MKSKKCFFNKFIKFIKKIISKIKYNKQEEEEYNPYESQIEDYIPQLHKPEFQLL